MVNTYDMYVLPTFRIREFEDYERLSGHRNYKMWKCMIELILKALNVLPFLVETNNDPILRQMLNAQTMQYFNTLVSQSIRAHINETKTTMIKLKEFEGDETQIVHQATYTVYELEITTTL